MSAVCGTIGAVDRMGSSGGSWGDGDGRESETVVSGTVVSGMVASGTSSFATFITSTSGRASVRPGAIVSGFEPPGVWSGRHSRFDFSQRGQTQLLDLGNERGVGRPLKGWLWDIQSSQPFPIRDGGIHSTDSERSLPAKGKEAL